LQPHAKRQGEKSWEIQGGGQEMAVIVVDGKNFNDNSEEFVLLHPSFSRNQQKFTKMSLLKTLPLTYYHSKFLAVSLDFIHLVHFTIHN